MKRSTSQIIRIIFILLIQSLYSHSQTPMATWIGGNNQYGAESIGELGFQSESTGPGVPGGAFWGFKPATWWDDSLQVFWIFQGSTNKLWNYSPEVKQWKWVKGTDVILGDPGNEIGEPGVYGTLGLGDQSNVPGARYDANQWIDKQGNLYLYGGEGFGSNGNLGTLSDFWKFEPTTNDWVWIGGPSASSSSSLVYGIKGVPDSTNWPGRRMLSYTWTDKNGRFWLYSGSGGSSDMWMYDPKYGMWTWMSGEQVYGYGISPPIFGTKGEPGPDNNPSNRSGATNWIDSKDNLWLYGGSGLDVNGNSFQWLNDLWKFDIIKLQWTWVGGSDIGAEYGIAGNYGTLGISATSNYPGSRNEASAWIGPNGKIWFLGGEGFGANSGLNYLGILNDLWWFDPETDQWTWVGGNEGLENGNSPAGKCGVQGDCNKDNFPGGRAKTVGYTYQDDLYIFGGWGIGKTYQGAGEMNDLWKFSLLPTVEVESIYDITQTSFTVAWDTVNYARGFELDISEDNFQSYLLGYNKKELATTYLNCDKLSAGTIYDIRIRAKNSGCIGKNSDVFRQITVPSTPIALDPGFGLYSFTARWQESKGAEGYYLDVTKDNFSSFLPGFENVKVDSPDLVVSGLDVGQEYQYRLRSYNNAGTSPNSNVIRNLITGLDNSFQIQRNTLYPNPNSGLCTLVTTRALNSKFIIRDISGSIVFQGVTKGVETTIDLHHLRSGIYFLRIDDQELKLIKR